ncbi:MAG: zinc ribbon domain-containing protein [Clostridia bacterium]|nr:zinc ribbon domain-containing protein [Clostridia bacterium]
MKSVKPGRGPSLMSGIVSLLVVVIGIGWTALAIQMEAPAFFPIFGMMFIIFGVINAISGFANATNRNRFSTFDIVDEREEPDPLNQYFGSAQEPDAPQAGETRFCPYCGAPAASDYAYCRKCGKKLPE